MCSYGQLQVSKAANTRRGINFTVVHENFLYTTRLISGFWSSVAISISTFPWKWYNTRKSSSLYKWWHALSKTFTDQTNFLTSATNTVKPTSSVLYPHLFAKAAYYQTAEFPNFKDMVQFFHEAWDHPSRDLMIHIVEKKLFDNIPLKLTAKITRKHFP